MTFTAEMIAGFLGGVIVGDPKATVGEFAKIEEGRPGALSFLANPKYEQHIYDTTSSIVIVGKDFEPTAPVATTLIRVPDAYAAFAALLRLYDENRPRPKGISERASVAEGVAMGKDCYVGDFAVVESGVTMGDRAAVYPQCYIGKGVVIGSGTTVYAGAKIYEGCVIGSGVVINAGAVIGADGFGWAPTADGVFEKIPQLGNVVIKDGVDIGANTCIDRATMGSTVIRRGVKLDNLIQIGHNVEIGENSVAAAQVGDGDALIDRGAADSLDFIAIAEDDKQIGGMRLKILREGEKRHAHRFRHGGGGIGGKLDRRVPVHGKAVRLDFPHSPAKLGAQVRSCCDNAQLNVLRLVQTPDKRPQNAVIGAGGGDKAKGFRGLHFAGTPLTVCPLPTSRMTTAPAPTTAFSPMTIFWVNPLPLLTTAPTPTKAPSRISTFPAIATRGARVTKSPKTTS